MKKAFKVNFKFVETENFKWHNLQSIMTINVPYWFQRELDFDRFINLTAVQIGQTLMYCFVGGWLLHSHKWKLLIYLVKLPPRDCTFLFDPSGPTLKLWMNRNKILTKIK
jgi:hypothetical protein